jgi:hypothetical protein
LSATPERRRQCDGRSSYFIVPVKLAVQVLIIPDTKGQFDCCIALTKNE